MVDGTNLSQVQTTLYKLGGQAQKKGFAGPVIGVKQGETNKREFSEQQLKEGRNVIGLQVKFFDHILSSQHIPSTFIIFLQINF